MHSIVTTFRGADIKVEVANFCAAMDTLIDQNGAPRERRLPCRGRSLPDIARIPNIESRQISIWKSDKEMCVQTYLL